MQIVSVEFLCRNLLVRNRTSHVNVSKMHQDDKIEEVENFLHDVIRLLKLSDGTQNNLESTEDENQGRLSLLPRFKMVIKETEKTVSSFSLTEDLSVNDDVNAEDEFPKWIDQVRMAIFSRRFSREKCPTLTVACFFFFFFFVRLQSHSDWATFLTIETTKTTTIRPSPVSGN